MNFLRILTGLLLSIYSSFAFSDNSPAAIQNKDILTYLQEIISWRQFIANGDLTPDNARISLLQDELKQNSQKVLKNSFYFAHAESMLIEESQNKISNTANQHTALLKKIEDSKQQINDLETQINVNSQKLLTEKTTDLISQNEKLKGELKVERAHLELLNNFLTTLNENDSDDASLTGNINKLSRSVLGDLTEQSAATSTKPNSSDFSTAKDDSVFSMAMDLLSFSKKKHLINSLIEQTSELSKSNSKMLQMMRAPLQDAIKSGYALADAPIDNKKTDIDNHTKDLNNWVNNYNKLSAAALPLGQIRVLLDTSQNNLKEWSQILEYQWIKLFHHFVIRLGTLAASLMIPFIFLELAHRSIRRYARDTNRLRQLNIGKQIIFVTLLVLVIFLNFFTEFGSLATYAGFLTAGLAVALQTVLVSLTAHFFFIGRFGARAGDRVTIAGVTGDVVQVGMLRIYLMELVGDKSSLRPSGRIVAFPNSVLFSSTAFSKQISGTNYIWNDLTFVLDPKSDFIAANNKIVAVVNSIYEGYKKDIEHQHISLQQSTNLSVNLPAPRSEIRVKKQGLVAEVHYPVIVEDASKIYERIIIKIIKTFESDDQFRLILSTPFKVVPISEIEE